MSITIGFGYSCNDNSALFEQLKTLADKFDYGLLSGIEYCELDVKDGLEIAKKNEGWEYVSFLQSPIDREVALAFGIDQELTNFEITGKRPEFFDFLNQLNILCSKKCSKIGLFFSSEWYEEDRVRYSYGTTEDLISLLSMPGHWGMRYLIPGTGHLQDSDEIPFIFNLKSESKKGPQGQ